MMLRWQGSVGWYRTFTATLTRWDERANLLLLCGQIINANHAGVSEMALICPSSVLPTHARARPYESRTQSTCLVKGVERVRAAQLHSLCSSRLYCVPAVPPAVVERLHVPDAQNSIVPAPSLASARRLGEVEQEPPVPLYVSLCDEIVAACHRQPEAIRAGLKALQGLGVWGVEVNLWWSAIEAEPQQYAWAQYEAVFEAARETGLRVKVSFCFHGDDKHTLPLWVLQEGQSCPDIFFTDRAGVRNTECLSIGIDHVPVLGGRTGLQAYRDLMTSFQQHFGQLLGSLVTDASIGLGPKGESRYPSNPLDNRWNFPGIGEFQCYDGFMVASLSAAAQQVGQPHWGNSGPHDAGTYCQWPHQTGFFHHQGSWYSEYGRFFLQWYSSLLLQHADQLLGCARRVFQGSGVQLHARLPTIHWWYNQAAHAAELTAGHYNTGSRNGYLCFCQILAKHQAGLVLTGAEMRDCEQPSYALASPESLLLQLRATAASQQVPVTLSNLSTRFDGDALAEFERKGFEAASYRGIDLTHVSALSFGTMGDAMFEPQNWLSFKEWSNRLRQHNDQLRQAPKRTASSAANRPQQAPVPAAAATAPTAQEAGVLVAEEREQAVVG